MKYRWWMDLKEELRKNFKDSLFGNGEAYDDYNHEYGKGYLKMGTNTVVSQDAILNGNIVIGDNCMIGTGVILRGNVKIYDNVRIGYGVEVKDSAIQPNVTIGPLCYIGDSLVEEGAYLGALVRTSNHRLDRTTIKSWNGVTYEDTGFEKLGAWIKHGSSLGVGVVILPGRIVPAKSIFSPGIVITRNYEPGIYKLNQDIVKEG